MIDSHCHLEQSEYSKDRNKIIQKCKDQGLKAIITCCARPTDFDLTMKICEKWKNFVFPTVSIHPEVIKEITEKEKKSFFNIMIENKEKIVAIGETGLDYYWTKETEWRIKQQELFIESIKLAKKLGKPLVIHSRDAYEDSVKILEENNAEDVLMHMFGANQLVDHVIKNDWFVSMNTIVLKSKKHKKVVRDMPLERLLLETDAPWLAPQKGQRNDPTAIKIVAERIAEIKKISFEDVWKQTTKNAISFFSLPIKL